MFTIYINDMPVFSNLSSDNSLLINPKVTFSDNTAGSMTFTYNRMTETNPIKVLTPITIRRNNSPFWRGRIINAKENFNRSISVTCEGALAYLNDTIQEPKPYKDVPLKTYLEGVLEQHNIKCDDDSKKFKMGVIIDNKKKTIRRTTNYETSWEAIFVPVVENKAHLVCRYEEDGNYIDYMDEYVNTNIQNIEFGTNLLDYTKEYDISSLYTVILPRGDQIRAMTDLQPAQFVNIREVNNGSMYLISEDARKQYGWIEKVVDFQGVKRGDDLLKKAKEYIEDIQFENMVIEISAIDLSYFNPNLKYIKVLDYIRCVSRPHGLNRLFPVLKITVPLDAPQNSTYTLGGNTSTKFSSVGGASSGLIAKLKEVTEAKTDISYALNEFKIEANKIMNMKTNGYVTITHSEGDDYYTEAIVISDKKDWTQASRYWKWNINGLAYYDTTDPNPTYELDDDGNPIIDESGQPQLKLAITMDGSIVADFINAGTLNANIIRAGIIEDINKNTYWNLETGEFRMTKGSINLGNNFSVDNNGTVVIKKGSITLGSNFHVDNDGNLTAKAGMFSGNINVGNGNFTVDAATGNVVSKGDLSTYGNVNLGGNINIVGAVQWNASNSPVTVLYSEVIKPTPTAAYTTYPLNSTTNWHREMTDNDIYAVYSYDGGTTWTNVIQIRGVNGRDGEDGSDANVPTYIKDTYIDQTEVRSPTIIGGLIKGGELIVDGNIYTGYTQPGKLTFKNGSDTYGFIKYDDTGAGTAYEAQNRLFIVTNPGKALKIQSGGGLSIQAGSKIYIHSDMQFLDDTNIYLSQTSKIYQWTGSKYVEYGLPNSTAVFG